MTSLVVLSVDWRGFYGLSWFVANVRSTRGLKYIKTGVGIAG